jgi:hypothetical protein
MTVRTQLSNRKASRSEILDVLGAVSFACPLTERGNPFPARSTGDGSPRKPQQHSKTGVCTTIRSDPQSIQAARNCLRIFRASSGFCLAHRISAFANAAAEKTVVIGYEESSQLDVEPPKYFVLVTKGEKRVCRCEELGVVSAPLPLRIIEKCLASDLIVTDMVVSKCCNHMPWRFARMRCRKMMFPKISG